MPTSIIGNNQTTSPYAGNDAITVQRTGVPAGEWVECGIPSNIVSTSLTTEIATDTQEWKQADAGGIVSWTFNASPTEGLIQRTVANGWVLPAGFYNVMTKLFSDKTGASKEFALIEIVGDATTAVTAANKNKKKGKPS